jgi:hypothetical protein
MDHVVVEVGRVTLLSPKLTLAYDDQTAPAKDHGLQADLSPAVSSNVDQQALDTLPSSTSQWSGLAGLSAGLHRVQAATMRSASADSAR